MRWEDERYVRLYTRDTTDWLCLSFLAQGLFCLLLRKVDRAGILELGRHGKRGTAIAIGFPGDWPRLEPALDELLADGCVRLEGDRLLIPNFLEAQEAVMSDAARKRAERERARAGIGKVSRNQEFRDKESRCVTNSHDTGQNVTPGHAASRAVTPSLAEPSRTSLAEPAAAAATGEPVRVLVVEDNAPSDAPPRWPLLEPWRQALAQRMAVPWDWFRVAKADRVEAVRDQLQAEIARLGVERAAEVAAEAATRTSPKPRWLAWFVGCLQDAAAAPRGAVSPIADVGTRWAVLRGRLGPDALRQAEAELRVGMDAAETQEQLDGILEALVAKWGAGAEVGT